MSLLIKKIKLKKDDEPISYFRSEPIFKRPTK
jgi:hypothetical protein